MKKYDKNQLAKLVKQIINESFTDADYLYSILKSNIDSKIKSLNSRDLTKSELKEKGIKVANDLIRDFPSIKIDLIERKLSAEIVHEAGTDGIEIKEYLDYFLSSAKDRVKQLLDYKYKELKKEKRKRISKRKK